MKKKIEKSLKIARNGRFSKIPSKMRFIGIFNIIFCKNGKRWKLKKIKLR